MYSNDVVVSPEQEGTDVPAAVTLRRCPVAGVALAWLVGVLYAVSFFLPATQNVPGYMAFVFSVLFVFCIPMWLANPVFWIGLVHLYQGRYRSAGRAGFVALLLALSESWLFAGELRAGYFVWAGSMAVLAAAGLFSEDDEGRRRLWPVHPSWLTGGEATRIASRFRR